MAIYSDLATLVYDDALIARVSVAIAIAAETIRAEDPATPDHDLRKSWARRTLVNVDGMARQMLWVLIAQNKDATLAQIAGATDAAVQNAVDTAIELLL
jgi:hypothetical protein